MYYQKGLKERALETLNKAVELEPPVAEAFRLRSLMENELGKWDAALADINRAIELEPKSAESYVLRYIVYNKLGREELGRKDFETAIRLDTTLLLDLKRRTERELQRRAGLDEAQEERVTARQ